MQATILRFLGAVILLAIAALAVQAVEGDTLWTCNYGGEWHEMAHALCSTDDGGCVLAGYTQHDYAGPQNMYAVRVNAQGDTLWTEEYGSDMYEKAYAICPAPDGGASSRLRWGS